jgi:hypothetical protein
MQRAPRLKVKSDPEKISKDMCIAKLRLLGHSKILLVVKTLDVPEDLIEAATQFLEESQPSEMENVSSHCIERFRWVIENNGDYDHDQTNHLQKHLLVPFSERWRDYVCSPIYCMNGMLLLKTTWSA